jgi:hypothetical protein
MSPPKTVLVIGNVHFLNYAVTPHRKMSQSKRYSDNAPANNLTAGANRGIGFQLATRFLEGGYAVYGTFRPQTRADPSVVDARPFPIHCSAWHHLT